MDVDIVVGGIVVISLAAWIVILLLPWGPWRTREILEEMSAISEIDYDRSLDDLTVLIPARNEAEFIQETLEVLAYQTQKSVKPAAGLRVIVVDDCSHDGTAAVARRVSGLRLMVIEGQPLPEGWAGKLWALEQGLCGVETHFTLLLDADIRLEPGVLFDLIQVAEHQNRALVSVMAALPMQNFWEKLLTPAFIYFFKMLYPFALANGPDRRFASAAGGCMLVETNALREIGGFKSIREALIDDCTLASRIKSSGYHTWTGLSHKVKSMRRYRSLAEIWNMVARSAFTQLRYSVFLLSATTLGLIGLFWGPFLGLSAKSFWLLLTGAFTYLVMISTYLPTIRFYKLSMLWALVIPVAATLYLGMTWTSAMRYWRGSKSTWKERTY